MAGAPHAAASSRLASAQPSAAAAAAAAVDTADAAAAVGLLDFFFLVAAGAALRFSGAASEFAPVAATVALLALSLAGVVESGSAGRTAGCTALLLVSSFLYTVMAGVCCGRGSRKCQDVVTTTEVKQGNTKQAALLHALQ